MKFPKFIISYIGSDNKENRVLNQLLNNTMDKSLLHK